MPGPIHQWRRLGVLRTLPAVVQARGRPAGGSGDYLQVLDGGGMKTYCIINIIEPVVE